MSKQYTKRQIAEAVSYWTTRLYEGQTDLLNDLEQYFGKDALYSYKHDFSASDADTKNVFQIINRRIFSGSLSRRPFQFLTQAEMNAISPPDVLYGAFRYKAGLDKSKTPYKVVIPEECQIYFITTQKMTIQLFVSTLCHEMIHQSELNDEKRQYGIRDYLQFGKPLAEHSRYFQLFQMSANSQGLHIMQDANGVSFKQLNDDAVGSARLLSEDECANLPVREVMKNWENRLNSFIRGKKKSGVSGGIVSARSVGDMIEIVTT